MPNGHYTPQRQDMVHVQLRRRDIRDDRVLAVMSRVPREWFVPQGMSELAYADRALDIGLGQSISQPYIVAYMTEQLDLKPRHRVLEIGTGSGYQTAVLAALSDIVYTVEHLPDLAEAAQRTLRRSGVSNVRFHIGDGTRGWPEHAPYDRIMVTAGAPRVPAPLTDQLCVGGKMVIPVGDYNVQRLLLIEKTPAAVVERPLIGCRFVKLIGQFGWLGAARGSERSPAGHPDARPDA